MKLFLIELLIKNYILWINHSLSVLVLTWLPYLASFDTDILYLLAGITLEINFHPFVNPTGPDTVFVTTCPVDWFVKINVAS